MSIKYGVANTNFKNIKFKGDIFLNIGKNVQINNFGWTFYGVCISNWGQFTKKNLFLASKNK